MDNKNYYQDVANRIRIDMDSRSPRLRLSVLGLLLDAGIRPDKEWYGVSEDWKTFFEELVDYVGAGLSDFATSVEQYVQEDEKEIKDGTSNMERAVNEGYAILDLKDYHGYM